MKSSFRALLPLYVFLPPNSRQCECILVFKEKDADETTGTGNLSSLRLRVTARVAVLPEDTPNTQVFAVSLCPVEISEWHNCYGLVCRSPPDNVIS